MPYACSNCGRQFEPAGSTVGLNCQKCEKSMEQEKLEDIGFHEWFQKYNEGRTAREPIPIGGDAWQAAFASWQYSEILAKQKSGTQALEDELEFLRLAFFRMLQCIGPADSEVVASIKQEFIQKTGKSVPGRYCE